MRHAITEFKWYMMRETERGQFLSEWLPEEEFAEYYELFSDFHFGGYRVLGDLVCDIDDENTAAERKQLVRDTDSNAFKTMMDAYQRKPFSESYKEAVSGECRKLLDNIVKPGSAVRYVAALGERELIWELLLDEVEKDILIG